MKKIGYFIILCLWVLGGVGGVGYAIYNNAWPIAIGAVVNAILAYQKINNIFNKLTE